MPAQPHCSLTPRVALCLSGKPPAPGLQGNRPAMRGKQPLWAATRPSSRQWRCARGTPWRPARIQPINSGFNCCRYSISHTAALPCLPLPCPCACRSLVHPCTGLDLYSVQQASYNLCCCSAMFISCARSGRMGSRQATTPNQNLSSVPASLGMQIGLCCHLVGTSQTLILALHCPSEDPVLTLHSTPLPQLQQR